MVSPDKKLTLCNTENNISAGKVSSFVERRAEMTTDGGILNNIQGVSVNLTGALHGSSCRQTLLTSDDGKVVEAELAKLEKKNVIRQRDHVADECVSTIFLRPQKDRSHRLILNHT